MEMETQLHPELAYQTGIPQNPVKYDVHPSLDIEMVSPEEPMVPEPVIETSADVIPEPELAEPEPDNDPQQRNWRELRAQAERSKQIEREAKQREEALERERDFYREQALAKQNQQEQEEDYRTDTEKQLAYEMEQLRAQVARQTEQTEAANRRAAISYGENRLLHDYPDIREVVSDENIKQLEYQYPHLYNSVIASNDVYTVGSTAYELILAKGIAKRSPLKSNPVAKRTAPNSASLVSPQSGETPIQRAGNFMGSSIASEDERKALYQEMINSSRNRV